MECLEAKKGEKNLIFIFYKFWFLGKNLIIFRDPNKGVNFLFGLFFGLVGFFFPCFNIFLNLFPGGALCGVNFLMAKTFSPGILVKGPF